MIERHSYQGTFCRTTRIGFPKLFSGWGGGLDIQPWPQPVNNFAAGLLSVTFSPAADTNVTLFRAQRT
jgi:hypothetical protein